MEDFVLPIILFFLFLLFFFFGLTLALPGHALRAIAKFNEKIAEALIEPAWASLAFFAVNQRDILPFALVARGAIFFLFFTFAFKDIALALIAVLFEGSDAFRQSEFAFAMKLDILALLAHIVLGK